jgi:hypothetical protein
MVVGIIVGSALVPILGWQVAQLNDIADIPSSLPLPMMPQWSAMFSLIVPAL